LGKGDASRGLAALLPGVAKPCGSVPSPPSAGAPAPAEAPGLAAGPNSWDASLVPGNAERPARCSGVTGGGVQGEVSGLRCRGDMLKLGLMQKTEPPAGDVAGLAGVGGVSMAGVAASDLTEAGLGLQPQGPLRSPSKLLPLARSELSAKSELPSSSSGKVVSPSSDSTGPSARALSKPGPPGSGEDIRTG